MENLHKDLQFQEIKPIEAVFLRALNTAKSSQSEDWIWFEGEWYKKP